jgi:hypothetical protein
MPAVGREEMTSSRRRRSVAAGARSWPPYERTGDCAAAHGTPPFSLLYTDQLHQVGMSKIVTSKKDQISTVPRLYSCLNIIHMYLYS